MKTTSKITKEQLIEFGMKENKGNERLLFPMEKVISVPNDEEGVLSICVTNIRNATELCLMMPDASCIYLNVATIDELKAFEKCISSWEPPY